jgi:dihydroorotase
MTGLATALPAIHHHLIAAGLLSWEILVERFCVAPRRLLGLDVPVIAEGSAVNAVLFDPAAATTFTAEALKSRSQNSPFLNQTLRGSAVLVLLGGKIMVDRC